MDAHLIRCALLLGCVASLGASYRTNNFVVEAPTAEMAQQIGQAAEKYRRDLAIEWLGQEMRNWAQPCPITAQVGDHLGAGGATSFVFEHGEVFGWRMTIQGSLVRILDSVLPHEVTHTIFATHFRQPLPRWADEGACTTVEHPSEKAKQQQMLIDFLRTGRGIAFSRMFAMKEYPHDVMPLYSQGYSVARYLIAQGDKKKFLEFIADGLRDENWPRAVQQHYGIGGLAALQNQWLDWVRKGSPNLESAPSTPALVAVSTPAQRSRPEANLILRRDEQKRQQPGSWTEANERGEERSVYELASLRESKPTQADTANEKWHAPRDDSEPAPHDAVASAEVAGLAQHQATRPQPPEQTRQIILEWSRPPGKSAGRGSAGNYPGPSDN